MICLVVNRPSYCDFETKARRGNYGQFSCFLEGLSSDTL